MIGDGPFDCICAFSEGAAVATSVLIHRGSLRPRCLILIAPLPPFDASGVLRLDISIVKKPILHIPTTIIQGDIDGYNPVISLVKQLFDQNRLTILHWTGGHQVPGYSQQGILAEAAHKIREAMAMEKPM